MTQPRFDLLFEPIQIGPVRVPNRLCEVTNTIGAGRRRGLPDDDFIANHVAKARGGFGWVGNEAWMLPSPVPPHVAPEIVPAGVAESRAFHEQPGADEALGRFCDAVHREGAVAVFQLAQVGRMFGPSAVPVSESDDLVPRSVGEEEIEFLLEAYGAAARALTDAEADVLEIHAAHESLPHLFLSPATNRRSDRWGGTLADRCRFALEAMLRARRQAGDGVAVGVRLTSGERRPGGFDLAEGCEIARRMVHDGGADYVSVDTGHSWGDPSYVAPSFAPSPVGADGAKAMREAVRPVPLLFAGRVLDAEAGVELLEGGVCDLVGMARASITDPELPAKVRSGRAGEVRRCIGCNRCIDNTVQGLATGLAGVARRAICSVNPTVGNERYVADRRGRSPRTRRVVVVGGGPAGLEAARAAARRGHRVTLLERADLLGGQVALAAQAPGREQFACLIEDGTRALHRLDVTVETGVEATPEAVWERNPEVVVCATGSEPILPDVPGVTLPFVSEARAVLADPSGIRGEILVVSEENGMQTPSVALLLAQRGCRVTVVHRWAGTACDVGPYTVDAVLARLEEAGVRRRSHLRLSAITGDGMVELVSSLTGEARVRSNVDHVVLSCAPRPRTDLYERLGTPTGGPGIERYLVGDAWTPRGIHEATEQAMRVALDL